MSWPSWNIIAYFSKPGLAPDPRFLVEALIGPTWVDFGRFENKREVMKQAKKISREWECPTRVVDLGGR